MQSSPLLISEGFHHHLPHPLAVTLNSLLPPAPAAAKSLQSCPTLCDPIDGNPPGSAVPGILQARTLEWVAESTLVLGKALLSSGFPCQVRW